MGILLVAQTVVAASTATLLLVLIRQYIVQRPLRIVPGPPSPSWITGNFKQMFSATSSPFHDELTKRYGKVATIDGMFGDKMLVISDTKALHSILIKDQPVFEPTNWLTEYVA
ncbi:hypothetical protein OF83DRAFT_285190 [Amylostereum chailletii]|nr:hypothetical protein OF83DRAFT_285190 [Amylostereum chailletii]